MSIDANDENKTTHVVYEEALGILGYLDNGLSRINGLV